MFPCLWELASTQTLWTCLIVAVAAFVQATVGFAAAMFGLPLLLWAGNNLMESQVLLVTAMLPQNLFSLWKLRRSIDLREVALPAAIRTAALPLGVAGLAVVMTWPPGTVQQFVGALILLALGIQTLVGVEWKSARRPLWMGVVFGSSGFMQGISGMSAPPMVLWVRAQHFTHDRARAFLFAMYISNFIPQMLLLWWKFGSPVFHTMAVALLAVPGVLISAMLGLRLGSRLGDRWMRPSVLVLLLWIGFSSLLQPWLQTYILPWLR
ncbi:MAG: sulfite exporter TauE/SafE family protein [Aureliella sp.]